MTEIKASELAELAKLSRLRLPDEECQRSTAEVTKLLQAFTMLQDANTDTVEPSAYPLPIPARLRTDLPNQPLTQEEVLSNAPQQRAGCFLVPRVVEG